MLFYIMYIIYIYYSYFLAAALFYVYVMVGELCKQTTMEISQ